MPWPQPILVVSHDATSLRALARALEQGGVPVISTQEWAEAQVWLRGRTPSVIVADVNTFSTEELEPVRSLRAEFPGVGVIAMVSLVTPESRMAQEQGLLLAVLEKPVALDQLEERVKLAQARAAAR